MIPISFVKTLGTILGVLFTFFLSFNCESATAQDGRLKLKNPLIDYAPIPQKDFQAIEEVLRTADVDISSPMVSSASLQPRRISRISDQQMGASATLEDAVEGDVRQVAKGFGGGLFKKIRPPRVNRNYSNAGLQNKIKQCLNYYFENTESADARSAWGVMHAAIGFGSRTEIVAQGRRYNAISWLSNNQPCRGHRILQIVNNDLHLRNGPGYQGHEGQFLAIMAQCGVKAKHKLSTNGQSFTVLDVIRREMATCEPKTELTFKLIGLSHYLKSDAQWVSEAHGRWTIDRLITEELAQPIIGVACGGTHRLMGLTYAVKRREIQGLPIEGEFKRADDFIDEFVDYTFTLQNGDGSFSTRWFERREADANIQKRLQTTGHILEWLIFTLDEEELTKPRMVRSVQYLADLMWTYRRTKWSVGPRGHAIRALALYNQRVFGTQQASMVPSKSITVAELNSTIPVKPGMMIR